MQNATTGFFSIFLFGLGRLVIFPCSGSSIVERFIILVHGPQMKLYYVYAFSIEPLFWEWYFGIEW